MDSANKYTLVLDFGHGLPDVGAVGFNNSHEYKITRNVGEVIGEHVKRHGINVFYTRPTDYRIKNNSNDDLNFRADFSDEKNATQFISIHCNAFGHEIINGFEIFTSAVGGERNEMAQKIYNEYLSAFDVAPRGIKHARFRVLIRPKAPACLVELGFLTNEKEEQFILDNIDKIGEVIAKGYLKHIGITWKDVDTQMDFIDLKLGMKNDRVLDLQKNLNILGFKLAEDKSFGYGTRSAVVIFQGKYKLPQTGVVNLSTWTRLLKDVEMINKTPKPLSFEVLKFGTVTERNREAQRMLNKLGYNLVVDGSLGNASKAAYNDFQRKNGLSITRDINEATWNKLVAESDKIGELNYEYKRMGSTHYVEIDPLELKLHMENTTGSRQTLPNFMNASFVWWEDYPRNTKSYPTSMLIYDGKIVNNKQPNGFWSGEFKGKGVPTPTFIIYKDGRVLVEDRNYFTVFEADKIHLAVSGIAILPTLRSTGFVPYVPFSSVAYQTNSIAIGYNTAKKKVVLAYHPSSTAGNMGRIMSQIGCNFSIRCDSGGSSNFRVGGLKVNATGRYMSAWLTW